jgi:hypothetical protein
MSSRRSGAIRLFAFAGTFAVAFGISTARGESYQDPVSGFEIHRGRSVIVVDSMLRTLSETPSASDVWERAVETVEWFITRLPEGSEYEILLGDEVLGTADDSRWPVAGDKNRGNQLIAVLRSKSVPSRELYLADELEALSAFQLSPERIVLVTAALPGPNEWPRGTPSEHLRHFNDAIRRLKVEVPVDVLLMPLVTDYAVAPAYWVLCLRTGGQLLTVGSDWPSLLGRGSEGPEYIAVVIDRSGSVRNYASRRVQQRVEQILNAPRLRYFQIYSDTGRMLSTHSGPWLKATTQQRESAVRALRGWYPTSNSNPVKGLEAAIKQANRILSDW